LAKKDLPDETPEERKANLDALAAILEAEKTHCQPCKQFSNFIVFLILVFLNLFRGSKRNPSLFKIKRCSAPDWSAVGVYVLICAVLSYIAVKRLAWEQHLK
jgi:hypothetical protein